MSQSTSIKFRDATNPDKNIAVFASAGAGKTQLLINRILKLLLNDVDHSSILAITFTRKAAAEMHERLMKELVNWAQLDDQQLSQILQELSYTHDNKSILKARLLYEKLLFSEHDIRITTFHAFCQDILKRFALHAGVPAGFRLIETTDELKKEALEKIFMLAQKEEESKLRLSLFELLKYSNTVNNVKAILDSFIESRSDWWSYTENISDPVEYATKCLNEFLFSQSLNTKHDFRYIVQQLKEYQSYLDAHATQTFKNYSDIISHAIQNQKSEEELLLAISSVFLTGKGNARDIKESYALKKSLGQNILSRFMELNTELCNIVSDSLEEKKKQEFLQFNKAWFYVGNKLLNEYQKIKFNRGYLDFDDLEWYTYLLLNKHDESSWIQYKLDQRIEHILIDEFQDTNPTQWNLLLPLLEELSANFPESSKSLFFVGDSKQSIYGFRRANPDLQHTASAWAKEKLDADFIETDTSFRSSPAIIDFINKIFMTNMHVCSLKNYSPHIAHKNQLWGKVQVEPIITSSRTEEHNKKFRDPLMERIENPELNCHYQEGVSVANNITQLIANCTPIMDKDRVRAVRYSDIMILARTRTHLPQLELALRENKIPYQSLNTENFLDHLEVQDILCLLKFLIQPHNDLALAQVLRSPCFAINDETLMDISIHTNDYWYAALRNISKEKPNSDLGETYFKLEEFRQIANKIPVHDLLDKIYFDLNILARYTCACPPGKNIEVISNLTHLLQLSLDFDSGRYSSIQSFLDTINAPGLNLSPKTNAQPNLSDNYVQVMTIHSAKGLEAPIVFLVDSGSTPQNQRAYNTVINWPNNEKRPVQFMIIGSKTTIESSTKSLLQYQSVTQAREELNLLYVALTRAKQYLFISGVKPKKFYENSWYSIISESLSNDQTLVNESYEYTHGIEPRIENEKKPEPTPITCDSKELSEPFSVQNDTSIGQIDDAFAQKDLATYGNIVHKLFELIEKSKSTAPDYLLNSTKHALGIEIDSEEFKKALAEVDSCIHQKNLSEIFNHDEKTILCEAPVSYIDNGIVKFNIIDRLIIDENLAHIIDYKTDKTVTFENISLHAEQHHKQLLSYAVAVKKLYPNKKIKASVLFTNLAALYTYDSNALNANL